MTLKYFQPLLPSDMTEKDIYWLAKMDSISYDGTTGADLLNDVLHGFKKLWRIANGLEGITVTSVRKAVLQLDYVSGKNLIPNLKTLHEELLVLAAQEKCTEIECVTKFAALQRLYQRLGYKPVGTIMRIGHGR